MQALLTSPQLLWRWELGDPSMAAVSPSPAGIYLTDEELATHLAFFFTDQPPDDTLRAAASAGTLRANLAAHVTTLLASRTARDWLRSLMEVYFLINQLPTMLSVIDTTRFPIFDSALVADMSTEARMFLDNALWNGNLTDLLLSRTTFVNSNLATNIYSIPVPAGATKTTFVETALPGDRRAGLLTNAGFLTTRASADEASLVRRGKFIMNALLCIPTPTPPEVIGPLDMRQPPGQTARDAVAYRTTEPACKSCHTLFDPFGLALENYDALGRWRTADSMGRPIDAHTTLPAAAGGAAVANGVERAQALAAQPAFTTCMATAMLQYALVTVDARVETPMPPSQAGCATADVVRRYQTAAGKTFADLVRATTAAPAFVLRRAAP